MVAYQRDWLVQTWFSENSCTNVTAFQVVKENTQAMSGTCAERMARKPAKTGCYDLYDNVSKMYLVYNGCSDTSVPVQYWTRPAVALYYPVGDVKTADLIGGFGLGCNAESPIGPILVSCSPKGGLQLRKCNIDCTVCNATMAVSSTIGQTPNPEFVISSGNGQDTWSTTAVNSQGCPGAVCV